MSSAISEIRKSVELSLVHQGRELGVVKGQRMYLLHQLRIRFGSQVDDDTVWRLGEADPEQLLRWSDRLQSEATLDEVLAEDPW